MYSFDDLSGALSEDAPSGRYLKLDRGEYRAIRNGYNTALSSFRQMLEAPDAFADEEKSEINNQNWQQFREQLNDALGSKTKTRNFGAGTSLACHLTENLYRSWSRVLSFFKATLTTSGTPYIQRYLTIRSRRRMSLENRVN